jgi:hypothetical protein
MGITARVIARTNPKMIPGIGEKPMHRKINRALPLNAVFENPFAGERKPAKGVIRQQLRKK